MIKIPNDKWGHLVVGAIAGGLAGLAGLLVGASGAWWPALALLAAAVAGLVREAWSLVIGQGAAEWADWWATCAGGAIVATGLAWGTPLAWLYAVLVALLLGAAVVADRMRASALRAAQDAEAQRLGGTGEE